MFCLAPEPALDRLHLTSRLDPLEMDLQADLQLPPDVKCDSDHDQHESDVELPEQLLESSCCNASCLAAVQKDAWLNVSMMRFHENLVDLGLDAKNKIWYSQIMNINRTHPDGPTRRTYQWHGKDLCQRAFAVVTQCPLKKVRAYTKLVAEGQLLPPLDARLFPMKRQEPKREDVDAFFLYMWENLAESLAIPKDHADDTSSLTLHFQSELHEDQRCIIDAPQWLLASQVDTMATVVSDVSSDSKGKRQVEKRWLPSMSTSELYDLYCELHADHDLAAFSTFTRCWKRWSGILGIRPVTTHSRCDACAKYSKFRKCQDNPVMLKAVTQGYTKHIQQVLSDRHIMAAMEEKVEQAMKNEHAEIPHIILQIDAMDKSKWMIPRDMDNSKRLSALWRPSLHFVGVLVPGIMEFFGILEADVKGDSNTQQTILSRVLELVAQHLQSRGRKMPVYLSNPIDLLR